MTSNKEECLKALNNLSRYANIGRAKHGAGGCVVDNFVSNNEAVIYNLICDHFDNPPLKFEELELEKPYWDNKDKLWCIYADYHVFYYIDGYGSEFEENRFYRKEVK